MEMAGTGKDRGIEDTEIITLEPVNGIWQQAGPGNARKIYYRYRGRKMLPDRTLSSEGIDIRI